MPNVWADEDGRYRRNNISPVYLCCSLFLSLNIYISLYLSLFRIEAKEETIMCCFFLLIALMVSYWNYNQLVAIVFQHFLVFSFLFFPFFLFFPINFIQCCVAASSVSAAAAAAEKSRPSIH